MKITNNPELVSRLASEYVLGTLRGGARRRFAQMMRADATLREAVAIWETHLTPLAEHLEPIAPPKRVWNNIESRISGSMPESRANAGVSSTSATPAKGGVWSSLTFWRGLGFAGTSLAAVLLAFTLRTNPAAVNTEPMMMAVLEDKGEARMIVEQPKSGYLMVKMVKPWVGGEDKSMELWVIPKDGAPRSLGLLNDTGDTKLAKPDMDIRLTDGTVFALSKEPRGGSPTGAPTGMVLCKGVIARMPAKNNQTRQGQI
jgi:anti-sigma-K factor RskA